MITLSELCPPAYLAETLREAKELHRRFARLPLIHESGELRREQRRSATYMAALLPILRDPRTPARTAVEALDGLMETVRRWSFRGLPTDGLAERRDHLQVQLSVAERYLG